LELFKSFQTSPWLVGEEGRDIAGQIPAREATGGGEGLAYEHQELKVRPGVGLGGRGDGWRWGSHGGQGARRGGARRRGASRRGGRPSSGLLAAGGGGEAIGVVGLDGEGAEVGVRRRQELTGEEGNDGDRAPVKDWLRGGVVELRRGVAKLPRWSSGTMRVRGGSSAATRGSLAKKERQWCLAAWGEWRAKERVEWKERELVTLLSQKRGGEGRARAFVTAAARWRRQSRGAAWHAREG
jgi:hypothetical protein